MLISIMLLMCIKFSICVGRSCCKQAHLCEISCFHSSFVDASGFLLCDTVLPGRCSQLSEEIELQGLRCPRGMPNTGQVAIQVCLVVEV